MHYKTNRQNHDFQIIYFLAGSCHTADGAYGLLSDLREDRENALQLAGAASLRQLAKRKRAEKDLLSGDESVRLEAEADLAEIAALAKTQRLNEEAARAELACIDRCLSAVDRLRTFRHLPDPEAHEAAQRDEWRLELIRRVENHLLTTGLIPADDFATMRLHPDFATSILPAIEATRAMLQTPAGAEQLRQRLAIQPLNLPELLRLSEA